LIEDLGAMQASYDIRQQYTQEAGYALARAMDADVLGHRAALQAISGNAIFNTAAPLNYNGLLAAKNILDSRDVPEEDRVLIVSTTQYNQLLAVDKFISMWYQDKRAVVTGQVGEIFGIPVIKTSQITANSTTGYSNGDLISNIPTPGVAGAGALYLPRQDAFTSLPIAFTGTNTGLAASMHSAILCHKEWLAVLRQKMPSVEGDRATAYLADMLVNSCVYGMRLFRPTNAVLIHTNAVLPAVP
jgi:N4-gp56 family major capsid protein